MSDRIARALAEALDTARDTSLSGSQRAVAASTARILRESAFESGRHILEAGLTKSYTRVVNGKVVRVKGHERKLGVSPQDGRLLRDRTPKGTTFFDKSGRPMQVNPFGTDQERVGKVKLPGGRGLDRDDVLDQLEPEIGSPNEVDDELVDGAYREARQRVESMSNNPNYNSFSRIKTVRAARDDLRSRRSEAAPLRVSSGPDATEADVAAALRDARRRERGAAAEPRPAETEGARHARMLADKKRLSGPSGPRW